MRLTRTRADPSFIHRSVFGYTTTINCDDGTATTRASIT